MIVLRIIATVLVSISFIVEVVKDANTIDSRIVCLLAELWSILWCTFVIVALWMI